MIVNGLKGDLSSSCLCWWWLNSCFEVQNLVCGPGLYFEDKHCNPTVNNMKYFPVILWVSEAGWPCLCKECLWSSYFFFPFCLNSAKHHLENYNCHFLGLRLQIQICFFPYHCVCYFSTGMLLEKGYGHFCLSQNKFIMNGYSVWKPVEKSNESSLPMSGCV